MYQFLKFTRIFFWYIVMSVIFCVFAYPFFYAVMASFMDIKEFGGYGSLFPWPKEPTLVNFKYAFSLSGALSRC